VNNSAQRLGEWGAATGIILGSGLNTIVPGQPPAVIPYSEFGEIPQPSCPGHEGRFALCEVVGFKVIFAQGRVHLYEGRTAKDVTAIVRTLARAGIKNLILTNAAGSARPDFFPGKWMMMSDHLNLTGTSPLLGAPDFIDMTSAYSPPLRDIFRKAANKANVVLHEGVYAGLLGPQYETPAEVRMLQKLGADAIGMSTVLEAIQARALGLNVAAFSCLTNFAAGIAKSPLSHEEVLETGKCAAGDFARLLNAALPGIGN
jgi:purine-nucleoside phosphorylase